MGCYGVTFTFTTKEVRCKVALRRKYATNKIKHFRWVGHRSVCPVIMLYQLHVINELGHANLVPYNVQCPIILLFNTNQDYRKRRFYAVLFEPITAQVAVCCNTESDG